MAIQKVGVVGCGLMGSGIAEVAARAGFDVTVREVDAGALAAGRRRIEGSLAKGVEKGKLTAAEREALKAQTVHAQPATPTLAPGMTS